jgi:hypothetical protein
MKVLIAATACHPTAGSEAYVGWQAVSLLRHEHKLWVQMSLWCREVFEEAVIGEHGAGFNNLLWCKPGCRVMELCSDNYLNGCYEGIALMNRLQYDFEIFRGDSSSGFVVPLDVIQGF